jgi:hypothetical protein
MLIRHHETPVPAVVVRIHSVLDGKGEPVPPTHPDAAAVGGLLYVKRPNEVFALKCQRIDKPLSYQFEDIPLIRDLPEDTDLW